MNRISLILSCLALASCTTTADAQAKAPAPHNELYYQRSSLFAELPIEANDIVFLGDSQTQGCEWHELFGMPNIKNRGINGDIIPGFLERVDPIVNGHPKKIFILGGANDVSHNLTADSVAHDMAILVDYIRKHSPESKIYVQTMLPINNSFGRYKTMAGKEDVIRQYNALLPAMAAEKGFTLIDAYTHFADKDGNLPKEYTNDGLHVMGPGYIHWRKLLLPYVVE